MSRVLQITIELYWFFVPAERRRSCIFRESCSRHVWRRLDEGGLRAGVDALRSRWRQCRPGYQVVQTTVGTFVLLRDGSLIPESDSCLNRSKLTA